MRPRASRAAETLRIICRCAMRRARPRVGAQAETPNLELPSRGCPRIVRMLYYTVDGGRVAGLPGPAYMEWGFARLRRMGYSVVVRPDRDAAPRLPDPPRHVVRCGAPRDSRASRRSLRHDSGRH